MIPMIAKYSFGAHEPTGAVTAQVEEGDTLPYFSAQAEGQGTRFCCPLEKDDIVYGLGETMRGIDKRGGRYVSFNTDNPHHKQDMPSLYGSHNFIVVDGKKTFGAFFDTPARAVFEIDYGGSGEVNVLCERGVTVYIVEGESAHAVVRRFLRAVGRSYLPPLWAFGFGQSRWGYKDERDIRRIARGYAKAQMPLDYICMDIDYMDRYIDFTVNKKRFPDLKAFVAEMKGKGVRLVPIVDAGIKVEPGDPVYEEGVQKGYFCKNIEGKDFCAAVWPGMTHFPDFLRPEVRAWFGRQYKVYTDAGIEGFWNDMNEPAIFYSEYTKGKTGERSEGDPLYRGNTFLSDYRNFCHNIEGKEVNHWEVHNIFGANMTRASAEGLEQLLGGRYLLFSRSSYIGAHRCGGIWTGDNASCWDHLRQNVLQMPSLNMCGFLFSGADTGGFGGNASRELLLRWLAVSAFTPLFRDHASKGTRPQECFRFRGKKDFRAILSLRYRLLPYIYSEFMKAALSSDMYIQPLAFGYPQDSRARRVEDELLVGESLLIAPVLEKGAKGRRVYLPEAMTEVRWDGASFSARQAAAGEHFVKVPLGEVVFYIRKGKLLPVGGAAMHTGECDLSAVTLLGDGEEYEQYLDDGLTRSVSEDNIRLLRRQG